jgi:membrane protein
MPSRDRAILAEGQRTDNPAPGVPGSPTRMPHAAAVPENPTDLPSRSLPGVLKRTVAQFGEDKLTTWAAALTYYAVLSIFPALLALVSILGVIGPSATQPLLDNLSAVAPGPAKQILTDALKGIESSQGASTLALVIGLATAIWSASGYIGAFMDAANAVWDAPEGRPIWKRIPLRIAVTVVMLILLSASALAVVLTGPIARSLGDLVGLGSTFVTVWGIVKWPVLVLVVSFMISLLFWAGPNVKQPGFPWVTPGGLLAVVLWIVASLLFALYVSRFASYNKVYGSLGGVIVFLVWLWITNLIVLLGAEFNSELERSRQIAAGHPPGEEPYLPLRDEPKGDRVG